MTTHFFTYGDEQSGSSRQRAFRIAEELNTKGIRAVVHRPSSLAISATSWPKKGKLIVELLRALASIKKGDIVYIQRAISNKYFFISVVLYVLLSRRRMIFDFDDPIHLHSFLKTVILTYLADAVIVNHHALAEWARRYNSNIHIIHIALNFAEYKAFEHDYAREHSPLVIGWSGNGVEHRRNLMFLADVLREVRFRKGIPDFSFTLVGALGYRPLYDMFQSIPGLSTRFVDSLDWDNPKSVPREIQTFDIGVIPSATDPKWAKYKSSFKIIEYMACAVPVVASRFGEMSYILTDDTDGYLASDKEEFVEKLRKLLVDAELRRRIGKAGQEKVHKNYCFDAVISRYTNLLHSLIA